MKKILLIDVDDVIVFPEILNAINEFMNTNYIIDDFSTYFIEEEVIPKERLIEFNNFLKNKNLYNNPHLLPNSIEVIKELNEVYDLYICSSCINPLDINNSANIFKDKFNFLIKTLPFINPRHFIFTSSKNLIKADIIIDDLIDNLKSDIELKILFSSYHNKKVPNDTLKELNIIRAGNDWRNGWEEIKKILL